MNVLFDWFNANKLTLNLNKSVFMLFQPSGQNNVDFHLELNGVTIACVKSTKFLGVWLDESLSCSEHMSRLILKLKNRMFLLYMSKSLLSQMNIVLCTNSE